MDILMSKGSAGPAVDALRAALRDAMGADAPEPALATRGAPFDNELDMLVKRWQAGVGVIADGVVGPRCQSLLGLVAVDRAAFAFPLDVARVTPLFPATKPANIARYLPYVEAALAVAGLTDHAMTLGALGTIRAETEGFVPIAEFQSKFNTDPGKPPFGRYDGRLGNGPGDGARYKGRGFVQLTGKDNYRRFGAQVNLDLIAFPDLANAPEVAAVLLALFLAARADDFRDDVARGDYAAARRLVNGGSHGLAPFRDVFARAPVATVGRARRKDAVGATPRVERASKTRRDAADLRDREFMPAAATLPDQVPDDAVVARFLPRYAAAKMILDQGRDGACTGFGLTCVINYLRWLKQGTPAAFESVSPRMLYTLARRHDETEGEDYEGSSCRGAIKGWFNHGVCLEADWPYRADRPDTARYGYARRAAANTLGVYYRVDGQSITDLQAAIAQHGAIFVSAFTHAGWDGVGMAPQPKGHADLPVIAFDGRASLRDGHAFALVGYNAHGFVMQNSWGRDWGAHGFAVLGYLDWLANGMDAWVVSLGVPGVVAGRLAVTDPATVHRSTMARGARPHGWDAALTAQHAVVLGDDGRVDRYLTEDEPPRKLQHQGFVLPNEWFRAQPPGRRRLVLYVHGGLAREADALKRASVLGRCFVGNGCYPLFLVWRSGLVEALDAIVDNVRRRDAAPVDRSDFTVEKTIARPYGRPVWSEMKEIAGLAFAERRGGDLLVDALQQLAMAWGDDFELHLVAHSAGALPLGHLLSSLAARERAGRDGGLAARVASIHLYAPACTVAFANRHYAADARIMERLHLDVLADDVERADHVTTLYRKSLLYLASNALEADVRTPMLGMDRVSRGGDSGWDGSSDTNEALALWRQAAKAARLEQRTTRVTGRAIVVAREADGTVVTAPAGHGTFDRDVEVVERTLSRITGGALAMPVEDLRAA